MKDDILIIVPIAQLVDVESLWLPSRHKRLQSELWLNIAGRFA